MEKCELNKWLNWFCDILLHYKYNDVFPILHLVDLLGATLMGVKPAKLLNIDHWQKNNNFDWGFCKYCILENKKINLVEITEGKKIKKVFFYHIKTLDNILRNSSNLEFLKKLGYPQIYSLENYVNFIAHKLKKDKIPHEIGLFLGYPLKDVLGFMGYKYKKPVMVKGWQYYGDSEESFQRYQEFWNARSQFREIFIENLFCLNPF